MEDPSRSPGMPSIPGVELVEVIGGGGSGIVYRGRQKTPQRDVAVKVVSPSEAPDEAMARWRREVSAMGRLSNHPNIVGVHSGGVTDAGQPYLVMPYVPTGTLADRLRNEGAMPPAEVATVGAKLAGALEIAHAAGVLHRDLKPANVLVSPYGEPQLADFGIARLADSSTTAAGTVHATIPYAAPEVLDGAAANEAADVYGLGATLHACLTGSAPFAKGDEETLVAFVSRIARSEPPPLAGAGVPSGLAAVVERAMAKDPEARHRSAADLQHELEHADVSDVEATSVFALDPTVAVAAPTPTEVVPVAAPPDATRSGTPPGPPAGNGSGNRGLWAAIGLVAVVILALFAYAAARDDGDDRAADELSTVDDSEPTTTADTSSTEPSETTESSTTTTTAAPTTTEATTTTARGNSGGTSDLAGAAVRYIETLDRGAFDDAWSLTSPRFQREMNRSSWERFWSGFSEIEIVGEARVSGSSGAVVVPLTLDGQREDYRLTFVEGSDGAALVDGPIGN